MPAAARVLPPLALTSGIVPSIAVPSPAIPSLAVPPVAPSPGMPRPRRSPSLRGGLIDGLGQRGGGGCVGSPPRPIRHWRSRSAETAAALRGRRVPEAGEGGMNSRRSRIEMMSAVRLSSASVS